MYHRKTETANFSARFLEYAQDLALRDDAQVIVVHAFEPMPRFPSDREALRWNRILARHVAAGEEVANEAAQKLQEAGVDVIVEVLEAPPADAVQRVADVRQPD